MIIDGVKHHGDPSANRVGHWGKQTSLVDWCEENYVVSYYVAEYWNTFTNLAYLAMATYIYVRVVPRNITTTLMLISTLGVWIGSSVFHATLKLYAQMLDELPMLFLSGAYLLESVHSCFRIRWSDSTCVKSITLFALIVFITNYVLLLPAVFPITFGASSIASLLIAAYQYRVERLGSPCLLKGVVLFLLAFVFWLVDCFACKFLRLMRSRLPNYLAVFLQFHGLWHILTAVAGALFIKHYHYVRRELKRREE